MTAVHHAREHGAQDVTVHGVTVPANVWNRIKGGVPQDYTEAEFSAYSAIALARERQAQARSRSMTAAAQHTQGPWRWELNEEHKSLSLVGGKPQFDLTIIQPVRWGMSSATLSVRDTAYDGMNLLHKVHERRDWVRPFHGRAHHARWCAGVVHPDMRLIESAPELLDALRSLTDAAGQWIGHSEQLQAAYLAAHAVLAKATGGASS